MSLFRRQFLLLAIAVIAFTDISGQVAPPAMAMPSDENRLLIDKIIETTDHEQYFIEYCTKRVTAYGRAKNWSQDKTLEILKGIKFQHYNSTIYNSYASFNTSQLTKLLETLTMLKQTVKDGFDFVLTNGMMQSNLDLFIKSLIEGKYVESDK